MEKNSFSIWTDNRTRLSCPQVRRLCGRLAMRTWPFRLLPLLLTAATVFLLAHAQVPLKKNLTIGYLTAIKGDLRDRQGLTASGAVQMAVDEVRGVTLMLNPTVSCLVRSLLLTRELYSIP